MELINIIIDTTMSLSVTPLCHGILVSGIRLAHPNRKFQSTTSEGIDNLMREGYLGAFWYYGISFNGEGKDDKLIVVWWQKIRAVRIVSNH